MVGGFWCITEFKPKPKLVLGLVLAMTKFLGISTYNSFVDWNFYLKTEDDEIFFEGYAIEIQSLQGLKIFGDYHQGLQD